MNNQCGVGNTCVNYYPQLNAGTFVPGQSNSQWPSWQQTLSTDLKQSLPVDPINKFSACGALVGADPVTCWKEATREFQCSADSRIYGYKLEDFGKDYQLYSNFEYDAVSSGFGTFVRGWSGGALYNGPFPILSGVNNLGNISTILDNYCTDTPIMPGSNTCGNGVRDLLPDETLEECDGGFLDNICRRLTTDPIVSGLGDHPWWNEQVTGCNPPGTPNECQWYDRVLTAEMCGGYCRDNILERNYENCDIVNSVTISNGFFHCPSATVSGTYDTATTCNNSCNMTCPADGLPAAKCGDGVWTSGREACDPTASPNGLAGWDCPNNGNVVCGAVNTGTACHISCDNSQSPYRGFCGDGIVQNVCSLNRSLVCTDDVQCSNSLGFCVSNVCSNTGIACSVDSQCVSSGSGTCVQVESCDYADYDTPLPSMATATNAYTCSTSCNFVNQPYCGDNKLQYDYREFCDTTLLTTVRPVQSSEFNQYQCRMVNYDDLVAHPRYTRCTPTSGGYCGDNIVQDTYGEFCDGTDYPDRPTPEESSETNTYDCADSCLSNDPDGGYCGDRIVQTAYEQCDLGEAVVKRADVVFVFDMSASMELAASNLCSALSSVVTSLMSNNVDFRITIMPLGDGSVATTALSPITNDNIDTIFTVNEYNADGSSICLQYSWYFDFNLPGAVRTFNSLVPNCTLPTVTAPNSIRYLSFYNTANNNINNIIAPVVATSCVDMTYPAVGMCVIGDQYAGNIENWGYATERIARGYGWQSGYQRIIVPVSDEFAWCGGFVDATHDPSSFTNDDNYGPSVTSGWLYNAVQQAQANNIRISPVFLNTYGPAVTAATNVADATGGQLISTDTGWDTNIMRIINSAFCDGNGDGVMDCSFP
jgi:hypothetical protein